MINYKTDYNVNISSTISIILDIRLILSSQFQILEFFCLMRHVPHVSLISAKVDAVRPILIHRDIQECEILFDYFSNTV